LQYYNSSRMALAEVEGVIDVHEEEMAYLRRSVDILKADNRRLQEKADHLETRLLFFVEANDEKTVRIDELLMQLADSQVRERELMKELDGYDKPTRKSSIFGRKFSRKNSMMSMHSSSHDTVHEGGMMHVSQSSPFLLSSSNQLNGLHHGGHHGPSVAFHRGGGERGVEGGRTISHTLSSCDDVASIALSARASPDLSSIDGESSVASYQRLGSTTSGGVESVAGLAVGGGGSGGDSHDVTPTVEEKTDEERENQEGGGGEGEGEKKGKEKPKRKRSLWMRVTSGLPKIPGEFVV
ncbi:hypothetical protein PFISCL1PPCAC_1163, partial [Pristionchus fissidentatus]